MSKITVLKNGNLINENAEVLLHQNVYIQDGRILKIVEMASDDGSLMTEESVECSSYYITSGLANLHAHTAMNIFKGISEDVTADAWFNEMIWPYESKMTDEDVYVGTMLGLAEMINNGVTCVADHYFGEEQVLKAVLDSGIRSDMSPTVFGMTPDFPERLEQVKEFIQTHRADSERISFRVGAHSNYTCPGDTLGQLVDAAKSINAPLHLHLAEEPNQVIATRQQCGKTPFEVFADAGGFECPVLVAHGLWIEEGDLKFLRDDTWFAFCPKTYMKLAAGKGGFFALHKQLNYSFGTDGAASSNTLSPVEQARLFALLGKFQDNDAEAYDASEIWKRMMVGHKAFAFGTGRMTEGAPADLVIWDLHQLDTFPIYNPITSILYSSSSQNVKYTMVGGEFLKYDGKLKMDTDNLIKEAARLQKDLLARGKGKATVLY